MTDAPPQGGAKERRMNMRTELYNAFEAIKNCYDLCMDDEGEAQERYKDTADHLNRIMGDLLNLMDGVVE